MDKRIFKRVKRTTYNQKNVNSIIKLGDIVFIHNHNAKRNVWKLGKVVRLFKSKDQNIRAATVKIYNQNPLYRYINRPVDKLYPFEVATNESVTQEELNNQLLNTQKHTISDTPERAGSIAADNSILIRRLSEQT